MSAADVKVCMSRWRLHDDPNAERGDGCEQSESDTSLEHGLFPFDCGFAEWQKWANEGNCVA